MLILSKRRLGAHGFTLVEMLVVMVIIGLLAGLVGPRIFGKVDTSKVQTAQTQIKMLKSSINIMLLDVGGTPSADQGLKWLVERPATEPQRSQWKGPYLDGALPTDPWGNAYILKVPGANGQPYSVISMGADGKEGGDGAGADIVQ